MKQQTRILLFIAAGVLLLAFGRFVLRPHEPSYQGRTLTEWLQKTEAQYYYFPDSESVSAIRHIGSKAVPTLLSYASAKDSQLKKSILKWNTGHPDFSLRVYPETAKHNFAERGFFILGPDAKIALPELIALLRDDDGEIRTIAAYCIGCIGPAARSAVPDLIKEFEREESGTNNVYPAAYALGKIGPSAQASIPSLESGLTNNNFRCRNASQTALINMHAISISPLLEKLNDTTNVNQWINAMMMAKQCGTNALPAVPLFISALNSTNGIIQSISLQVVGWLHLEPEPCVPAIVPLLSSKDDYMRQNAINALRGFGKTAKSAVPALLRCLDDADYSVRKSATNALLEIDPEAAAKAGIK
jgi:HEAT repeat protein